MNRFDRYIFSRLFVITATVLLMLIFIFVMIDFSENSDDFADQGAEMAEIFRVYYLNYVPEMTRLVLPVAVFVACLFLTGQLSDRLEITALKAAGVSLYRLIVPYLVFAILCAAGISWLDAHIIPKSNADRIAFEEKYLSSKNDRMDQSDIYRQPSPNTKLQVNYFDKNQQIAYRVRLTEFDQRKITRTTRANRMEWQDSTQSWRMETVTDRIFTEKGYQEFSYPQKDTVLNVYPRDLSRSTSDIYQLTYQEASDYIASIERSGAGGVEIPQVHFYGRLAYPFSIVVVMIVGFAFASVRRRGGKGAYLAAGLTISFLYLAFMKIIEPFGYYGTLSPFMAATLPHIFFFIVGIGLLLQARK
ncbi:LptF/LptG family permease [Gracilimonas mengyeensis]|uniref:Lipopolysaccharide export system permease protein n=1 Tax=Gracilimonas mengyeensis TaxID=1302730 RepID=A0A521AMW7_9BACT|nr:LptF/LptG family permease [Gracilimonas mengyeensis]SMO36158.1 lipopolysaccharide export system permease protein [Gracilimonas mengyeensis]